MAIDERLSGIEDGFLFAAAQGGPALTTFHDSVASNNDESLLPTNTMSSRVAVLTECLFDFKTSADAIQRDLQDAFAQIFIIGEPAVARVQSPPHTVNDDLVKASASPTYYSYPPYIELAFRWLLKNLHSPYPSKETRVSIALESRSDSKSVESWFIDARKRIGWNTLRKQHFSNKRIDIVDAATRFFVQEDDKRPVDPTVQLEFAGLQKRAKDLYADRFARSALATKLDIAVKDLTPVTKAQAREEAERWRWEAHKRDNDALAASSYPSPQRSPGCSPEPIGLTPLEEDTDLATTHPEAIAGRKRRSLSPDEDEDSPTNRPNKRSRLETPSVSTGLPSPTPSSHEPLRRSASPSVATESTPLPTISRKRRLSDADGGQGVPKRPRNLPSGPRLQAVSDPLPMASVLFEASSMDDWFNAHFGIPSPVVVDALDTSEPLDVEVFNYPAVDIETYATTSELLPLKTYPPQRVDKSVPPLVADEAPFATDDLEISTNDFDINELFNDYEEPETVFSGQNLANQPQDVSLLTLQPSLLDLSSITNFPAVPFSNTFNTNLNADANYALYLDDTSNINWSFPQFIQDSFSPINKLQDFGQDVLAQDPSLMFSNPILGLDALSIPAVSHGLCQDDKAEMEQRLTAMKEAMRHLEEKIAASSS